MLNFNSSTLNKNLNSITKSAGGLPAGIKIVRIQGLQALSSTGLLDGIRAMASRIFKTQPWRKPGERSECLYNTKNNAQTHYIIAIKNDNGTPIGKKLKSLDKMNAAPAPTTLANPAEKAAPPPDTPPTTLKRDIPSSSNITPPIPPLPQNITLAPDGRETHKTNDPKINNYQANHSSWDHNRLLTATKVDEVTRILRASHPIGILGEIVVKQCPPSDRRIEQKFEESLTRMQDEDRRRKCNPNSLPECSPKSRDLAEKRLRAANILLKNKDRRSACHYDIISTGPPITRSTRCPIDIGALKEYAASNAGAKIIITNKKHQQHFNKKTIRYVITEFLDNVTPEDDDNNTGYIDIHYSHGRRTAALVATGWFTGGREYAKNADPFKLPRRLRNLALRRFGHDFDDSASYPRAALFVIQIHKHLAGILLGGENGGNRNEIMKKMGDIIFPISMNDVDKRSKIKHLINLLDMDGTYGGWRMIHNIPSSVSLGDPKSDGPHLTLASGDVFSVKRYFTQQPQRTEWIALCFPHLLELEEFWHLSNHGETEPPRTLKSDILAEHEAISRTAKVLWAINGGHDWLSLQHDGVVIALRDGTSKSQASSSLSHVSSASLGYFQPVEPKPMETDSPLPTPDVLHACYRSRDLGMAPAGGGRGGSISNNTSLCRKPFSGISGRGC